MLVYLAAALTAAVYLMCMPVRAGAAWKKGGGLKMGVTVGPFRFSARGDMKYVVGSGLVASLTHDQSGRIREISLLRGAADGAASASRPAALSRALKYLFRHIRPWKLRARIHLSLPDAAQNALLGGLLKTAFSTLRAMRPDLPLTASVTLDFRSAGVQAELLGILSCRLGHIMAAGLIWCRDYLSGRLHTWTSNRSKAS